MAPSLDHLRDDYKRSQRELQYADQKPSVESAEMGSGNVTSDDEQPGSPSAAGTLGEQAEGDEDDWSEDEAIKGVFYDGPDGEPVQID
jgi:hypothetical protein